jgi:hypothetical protein
MLLEADLEVVYKDMKLGFLAGDTDHGTREVSPEHRYTVYS